MFVISTASLGRPGTRDMESSFPNATAERKWRKTINAAVALHTSGTAVEGRRRAKPVVRYEAGPASGKLKRKQADVEKEPENLLSNPEVVAAGKLHGMRWMNSNVYFSDAPPILNSSEDDIDFDSHMNDAPALTELEFCAHRCVGEWYQQGRRDGHVRNGGVHPGWHDSDRG